MEKMMAMMIIVSHSTNAYMLLAEPLRDSNQIFAIRTACAVRNTSTPCLPFGDDVGGMTTAPALRMPSARHAAPLDRVASKLAKKACATRAPVEWEPLLQKNVLRKDMPPTNQAAKSHRQSDLARSV